MKKIYLFISSFLCFAFIIQPQRIAESICAGYDPDYYDTYSFFEPISFEALANFEWKEDRTQDDNLKEWQNYFQNKVDTASISKIIYQATADEMQKIRTYTLNNKSSLKNELKNNDLVKYWTKNKDIEAIDYLFYAKVCEPEAMYYDEWNKRKRDVSKMKYLTDEGKKYFKEKASNDFLRLRFAYQAIRMAHYSNQYKKAIQMYDELVKPLFEKSNSIIKYWALSLKAGALKNSGEMAEAAYLFSVVFDKCPSKLHSSFLSFELENQVDFDKALGLSKNAEEKANLYFMRALKSNANLLEEMQNIYSTVPNSDRISVLLAMAINQLENSLLNIDLSKNLLFFTDAKKFPEQTALQALEGLKKFVLKGISEKKVNRPDLFALANGYLNYLSGNSTAAMTTFEQISRESKDLKLKNNAEVFKIALQISQLKQINETTEEEIYKKVKALNNEHLQAFMVNAFARLYDMQNEIGKAYLCRSDVYGLKTDPNEPATDNLLLWVEKTKMTAFEKEILLPKIDEKNAKNILLEIKATILFGKDQLEKAIAIYQQIPESVIYKLEENPFQANIKDCWQSCENSTGKGKYNRLTLAQKIASLKKIAEKATIEQADVYFQLGSVYYNITHFGNSWKAVDYYRSGSDFWYAKNQKKEKPLMVLSGIFLDCTKAKYYFERAMNLATSKGDKELAAQACYMAAKCEQNQFYERDETEGWGFDEPNFKSENRKYFTKLKSEFAKTKHYSKLLQECSYFNRFVRR